MGHWERDLGGGDVPGWWFWHEGPETCEGRLMRSRMESLLLAACVCLVCLMSVPVSLYPCQSQCRCQCRCQCQCQCWS